MTNRSNMFIVALDGLDVSGKETFSKSLVNAILTVQESDYIPIEVDCVSFPRYETLIGKKIKEILKIKIEDRTKEDTDTLSELMVQDRKEYFEEFYKKKYNKDKMHVIICDRYAFSNLFYEHLNIMGETDPIVCELKKEVIINDLDKEFKYLPYPDLTILFNRTDDESTRIHKELLKNKKDKDKNEVEEIMQYISNCINNSMEYVKKYSKRLIILPIGSNFEDDSIERGVVNLIITQLIENGWSDKILYPKNVIYYNNITLSKVRDLSFIPKVKMSYKLSMNDPKVKEDFNKFVNRVSQKMKFWTLSNFHSKYDPLKFIDHYLDSDFYNPIKETEDEVKISCMHAIELLCSGIKPEDYGSIYKLLTKSLFVPLKESKLNCNYIILNSQDIYLEPNEIRECSLNISLNYIKKLSKDIENDVIDLDIKTSRDCIKRYGVSIADSPSSISSDYEGMLSIILINHTKHPVKIPVGAPLATMAIKNSSCETEFVLD